MALNEFEKLHYLQEMRDRVTFTFEQRKVFDKVLQLLSLPAEEVQETWRQLMQERSIDTAVGKQLDIIGDIVGQPRVIIDSSFIPYFGYSGAFQAQPYGDLNDQSVGGYYWDIKTSLTGNVVLNDDQYRTFIKAKIIKNTTKATPENVISFIKFVFGADKVQITHDSGAEQALVMVSDDLDQFQIALLTYFVEDLYKEYFVPKTLGVGYVFGSIPTTRFFSFLGVPEGSGYGSLVSQGTYTGEHLHDGNISYTDQLILAPGIGGKWASIF